MTQKVNQTPTISQPAGTTPQGVIGYLAALARDVVRELSTHASRLNLAFVSDGSEPMTAPLPLVQFTVATMPSAALWPGSLIYVTDANAGAVPAYSDGTDWRRVTDKVIVT